MNRIQISVAAGLGLAQLVLLAGSTSGQELPSRSMDEVVVTATRSSRKRSETGKVVRVISAEQLQRSQGRSLPEVLNQVAGLHIGGSGNNPGDIKSVYLRGASQGNTLIMLDGVPVNDASSISGEFDIAGIALDQVERIEILKGGNSTLYGSDAVAGVINIITRKGSDRPAGNLLFSGGTYGTFREAAGLQGKVNGTSLAVNASNLDTRGFSIARPKSRVSGEQFDRDGFHQRSLSINAGQDLGARWSLKGNLQYNRNRADMDFGAFTDSENHTYRKESVFYGLGSKALVGRGELNLNISRNAVTNEFDEDNVLTRNEGRITNADAVLTYPLASFVDLTAGGTVRYAETDQVGPYGTLTADNHISSAFSSFFFHSASGLSLEAGGRINSHSEFGRNFTYTLNPSYLLAQRYKFFVNFSSAYKVPTLYQLYSEYGNLDLKPETSRTLEAGAELDVVRNVLNVSVAWFDRSIRDVIAFGPIGNRFGYINQDEQNDRGYEVELALTPGRVVDFTAFFAHVDGEITTPSGTAFNLYRRPKNTVGATAGLHLGPKLDLNVIYKWADERQDQYYDASIPPFGETVRVTLEPYQLLDLYAQYRPSGRVTVFSEIKNLLDTDYSDFVGFNTAGLSFTAGLRIGF
ncbi:MAG TPA: TonB-dependent receptor [Sphingobacteriaceae bacterium]